MMRNLLYYGAVMLALLTPLPVTGAPAAAFTVDHALQVWLQPSTRTMQVEDRITLPAELATGSPTFTLASDARIESGSGITRLPAAPAAARRRYRVNDLSNDRVVVLRYTLPMTAAEAAGDVFLSLSRAWVPVFGDELFSFSVTAVAPADWTVISQGRRDVNDPAGDGIRVRWTERQPQDDIYLIAGRFVEYRADSGPVPAYAFLRGEDQQLAQRYLDATDRYVALYSELIGTYPYAKFALVENTWDSGYGMPSFTLLGPRVIRLPFIIHTSYPHEVLHNWWGNSVYVDFDTGNWSEGLTAYLADHYLREQRGEGARYRRDALQKYVNYVSAERDFPISEFRAKHGEASEAVGYNKTLMFFHMLRRRLGDSDFFAGLRRFYADHRFSRAGFADIRAAMEQVSGVSLADEFDQWVTSTGAPALAISDVRSVASADGFSVDGELRQTQAGTPFRLRVPVRVTLEDGSTIDRTLPMDAGRLRFSVPAPTRPARISVDAGFDVFRHLSPDEVPATLSEAFGAGEVVFVTPADADSATTRRHRRFMDQVTYAGRSRRQTDADALPQDAAIWLLGWDNAHRPVLERALRGQPLSITATTLQLAGQTFAADASTVTLAARTADGRAILWTHLDPDGDAQGTARRLRHYGRQSYLVLSGGRPVLRDQWPVVESPLSVPLSPRGGAGDPGRTGSAVAK